MQGNTIPRIVLLSRKKFTASVTTCHGKSSVGKEKSFNDSLDVGKEMWVVVPTIFRIDRCGWSVTAATLLAGG